MNWFKLYMGDWARDTSALSLAEKGAYMALIQHYYSTEHPLPKEHTALYRIAGAQTDAERRAVRSVLSFFQLRDGVYYHRRIDAEIAKASARAERNRRNAAGGRDS